MKEEPLDVLNVEETEEEEILKEAKSVHEPGGYTTLESMKNI